MHNVIEVYMLGMAKFLCIIYIRNKHARIYIYMCICINNTHPRISAYIRDCTRALSTLYDKQNCTVI